MNFWLVSLHILSPRIFSALASRTAFFHSISAALFLQTLSSAFLSYRALHSKKNLVAFFKAPVAEEI